MKYKISIVSYLNSLPFVYGLENYAEIKDSIILSKDIPAEGAKKFKNNKSDIALVPVGALSDFGDYKIITDFCIGTQKQVDTVLLLTNKKLNDIDKIYLDYQSRTSVKLIKILAKYFWEINPIWINSDKKIDKEIKNINSALIIGDRAFEYKKYFKYSYDLAAEWNKFTNLAFTFAVWVTKPNTDNTFIDKFNKALEFGVNNINNLLLPPNSSIDYKTFNDYLKNKINYKLSSDKEAALKKYLDLSKTI